VIPENASPRLASGDQSPGWSAATVSISETFTSRQGEGKLTGTPSVFLRTNGCNLRCWFCDTPYASWNPSGELRTVGSLLRQCLDSGLRHVVLTGGEPLMQKSAMAIAEAVMDAGLHLTIETAGTIDKPIACDLLSISPKLAGSAPDAVEHPRWHERHDKRRLPLGVMRRLIAAAQDVQVKFVVCDASQFAEINACVADLSVAADDVFIMPEGTSVAALDAAADWLAPWVRSSGYRYCDRMQIRWYGNRRGT
jgi:7-carboxy-7-deazaguanine synthase